MQAASNEVGGSKDAKPIDVEPIVDSEDGGSESSGGFTGAAIGFAQSGTGIATIVVLLGILGAYGAVHFKRKGFMSNKE